MSQSGPWFEEKGSFHCSSKTNGFPKTKSDTQAESADAHPSACVASGALEIINLKRMATTSIILDIIITLVVLMPAVLYAAVFAVIVHRNKKAKLGNPFRQRPA